MEWLVILFFVIYAAIGIIALLLWWTVYEVALARRYSVREAVFGEAHNPAVALDLLGGILAMGVIIYAVISQSPMTAFRLDVRFVSLSILIQIVLMAVLRLLLEGLLRLWFRDRRDAQGDIITLNNELFKQRNIATGLLSTVVYFILAAGLSQPDLWNLSGKGLATVWNMLGMWLFGFALVTLHSFLYLGYGTRNHILHECFHDNNPAAAFSLMGLVLGMLPLAQRMVGLLEPHHHMLNSPDLWYFLGAAVLFVLLARAVLQFVLLAFGIHLRRELVISDNVAWGLLDGGLIFTLCLILVALMS